MEQTSRLSIVIDTGNAETTIRRLERSLSDLQRQGTNTANSLANLGRQGSLNGLLSGVARASGGITNLGSSVSRTTGIFNNYYNTLNRTTNNFNQFNNIINRTTNNITRMGDTINRNITVINNYNRSLSSTHDALSRLQGILTGGMFGVFALSVAKTADSMQETHSQIKLVTKSHEEYLVVADRLHEMAGKNLKDFQATAGLYTNSARALGQLGKSQEEVLKFTNAVSLAMGVGGKSAQEQAAALYQLGQAMQSGVVQGDEFRSLAENAPIMLDLVAESLGKTRGEVRELSKEGKITAEVMYKAMADATPKLQEMFNKMPVTMSQGFSVLKNEYKKFTHEFMNGEGGISSVVAKGLIWLSKNFDTLGKVAIAGAGVAMLGFASKVKITTTAFTVLGNVIKSHPVLAIATGVLGVASAFYGLDDVLNTTGIIFKDLFGLVTTGLNGLSDLVEAVAFNIKDEFAKSNQETATGFGVFFKDTEKGFTGLLHGISRVVASATGVLGGFFAWLGTKTNNALLHVDNAFIDLGNSIGSVFSNTANSIMDFLTLAVKKTNDMIGGLNQMLAKLPFGSFQIAPVDFAFGGRFQYKPMPRKTTNNATLSQHISDYVGMAVDINDSTLGSYFKSVGQKLNTPKPDGVNLNEAGQAQKPSSSDKDKDKKGKKGKEPKQLITGELAEAIFWLSDKYKLNPNDVAAVISFETRGTFSTNARNSGTSGTGLFQLMQYSDGTDHGGNSKKWDYYGLSRDQFGALSPMEQMYYFDKFFQSKGLKQGASLGDIYDAVAGYGYKNIPKYNKNGKRIDAYWLNRVWDADGDDVIRKGEAVTAKAFKKHIRNYFPNGIDLQAVGKAQSDVAKIDAKNDEQKAQAEKDLNKRRADIIYKYSPKTKQDRMDFMRAVGEVLKSNFDATTRDGWIAYLKSLYEGGKIYAQKLSDYELNNYKMTAMQKLDREKELALDRIALSTELDEQQKQQHRQAIIDKYNFDNEQFQKSQQEKIDVFRNAIQANTPALTNLTDMINKKYMSKTGYEIWQLNQSILAKKAEEMNRFADLKKSINEKDDTGNYIIDDAAERYKLLQQAEQAHQKELTAIVEAGKLERQELDKSHADYQMGLYKQGLDLFGNVWNAATDIVKKSLGEQSTAAKIMFGTQKAISIAQAILNTEQAYTKALAEGGAIMGVPMATMVKGLGYASVGLMASQAIAGFATGGYTGNVGTSQIAGVVHGQEYVVNAKATKRIGVDNLNKLNSGGSLGGVNIVINNYTSEKASVEQMPNGDFMVTIGKMIKQMSRAEARQVMYEESRQGGMLDRRR